MGRRASMFGKTWCVWAAMLCVWACGSNAGTGAAQTDDAGSPSGTADASTGLPTTIATSEEPACPIGASGCPCTDGGACDSTLACVDGVCMQPECAIGIEGCTCTGGGACDPGLVCDAGTCVVPEATSSSSEGPGSEGSSSTGARGCTPDGMVLGEEECDDGDEIDGDGCSQCVVDEGYACWNEPSYCIVACEPLFDDCEADEGCYLLPGAEAWGCAPAGSVGVGDECPLGFINECEPGALCGFVDCPTQLNWCCVELCDLESPACPMTFTCEALFEEGSENDYVGVCLPA